MFALPIYSLTMNIALNAGCYSEVEVLSLDEATGMSGEAVEDLLFEKAHANLASAMASNVRPFYEALEKSTPEEEEGIFEEMMVDTTEPSDSCYGTMDPTLRLSIAIEKLNKLLESNGNISKTKLKMSEPKTTLTSGASKQNTSTSAATKSVLGF